MEANRSCKKFVFAIKDFSLQSEYRSDPIFIGGYKWHLVVYPDCGCLSLSLQVATESLPCEWSVYTEYQFTIVNQRYKILSEPKEEANLFTKKASSWGFNDMISLAMLNTTNSEFLVNGELVILAEVEVIEVINTEKVSQVEEIGDESEEIGDESEQRAHGDSFSSKDLHNNDDVTIEVNGFQVLDSQVDQVRDIFEKHPDLMSSFNVKKQHIKNAYMYDLLELIKTLQKSLTELTVEDLNKAYNTLTDLTKVGLNLDWLCDKFDKVLEKHIAYDTRIRELERLLKKKKLEIEKEIAAASVSKYDSDSIFDIDVV